MLDDAGSAFPAVLRVVRPFLVPIRGAHHWLFGFTREMEGDDPLSLRFPSETLDMLSCIIADEPRDAPFDLSKVLDTIVAADPTLAVDVRFKRLADVVARRWSYYDTDHFRHVLREQNRIRRHFEPDFQIAPRLLSFPDRGRNLTSIHWVFDDGCIPASRRSHLSRSRKNS